MEKITLGTFMILVLNKQIIIKENYMRWAFKKNGGGEEFIKNFNRKYFKFMNCSIYGYKLDVY
jgi:hypothetical protein